MLNQAEKKTLEVAEGCGDESYAKFVRLQSEIQQRENYIPKVSHQEFRNTQRDPSQPLKRKIMICECDGEPVSTAVVATIVDTGVHLLGAPA